MNVLPFHDLDVDASFAHYLRGDATETGSGSFAALVENPRSSVKHPWRLGYRIYRRATPTQGAGFLDGGAWIHGWEMNIDGTPCAEVIYRALPDPFSR